MFSYLLPLPFFAGDAFFAAAVVFVVAGFFAGVAFFAVAVFGAAAFAGDLVLVGVGAAGNLTSWKDMVWVSWNNGDSSWLWSMRVGGPPSLVLISTVKNAGGACSVDFGCCVL